VYEVCLESVFGQASHKCVHSIAVVGNSKNEV
jgi:hypothetical protein